MEAPEVKLERRVLGGPGAVTAAQVLGQVRVVRRLRRDVVPGAQHRRVERARGPIRERHDVAVDGRDAAPGHLDCAVGHEGVELVADDDSAVQRRVLGLEVVSLQRAVLELEHEPRAEIAQPQRGVPAAAAEPQGPPERAVSGEDPVRVRPDGHRDAVRGAREVDGDLHAGAPRADDEDALAVEPLAVDVILGVEHLAGEPREGVERRAAASGRAEGAGGDDEVLRANRAAVREGDGPLVREVVEGGVGNLRVQGDLVREPMRARERGDVRLHGLRVGEIGRALGPGRAAEREVVLALLKADVLVRLAPHPAEAIRALERVRRQAVVLTHLDRGQAGDAAADHDDGVPRLERRLGGDGRRHRAERARRGRRRGSKALRARQGVANGSAIA